jgi:mono/diheme cytochrome c family protein
LVPVIGAAGLAVLIATHPSQAQSQAQDSADAQLATVKQYCAGCHSDRIKTGGVSFEGITAASIAKDPELFEKAVRKLRGRVMPPPGARQPDGKAVDALVAWLEDSLDRLPNEARVTDQVVLHRLNRKEYENAVRDLLSVDVNAAELLPPDDIAQGFDNIASALQVSPSFIEQYVHAARNVAVEALGKRDARESRSPRRRRIPHQHRRHGGPYLGQWHGVRESAGSDPGQQDRLSNRGRRRRRQ